MSSMILKCQKNGKKDKILYSKNSSTHFFDFRISVTKIILEAGWTKVVVFLEFCHSFWNTLWNYKHILHAHLWCSGCDAAGASPSWRPPDEERGGHGPGLCQWDHDPHALSSERDHHLHIQTGTNLAVVFVN